LGLYALVRAVTGDVTMAIAAYAAIQVTLLALALFYCIWPAAAAEKISVPVFTVLAVLGVSLGNAYEFQAVRMPTMHGFTITILVFCMGLLLRLAASRPDRFHTTVFFLAVAVGYAGDGIFLIWFVIPALMFLGFLARRRELPRRHAVLLLACVLLACLAGALCNAAFKPPTVDHSAVHIAFFKSLRAIPAMAVNLLHVITPSPLIAAMYVATILVVTLCRKRMPRYFILLGVLIFFCTVSGIIANGHSKVSYVLPVILVFPLFGVAMLPLCLPDRLQPVLAAAALLAMVPAIGVEAANKRPPFSPPLARCIDRLAQQYDLENGAGMFWEANSAPLFTQSNIPFTGIHWSYMTHYPFLMSSRHEKERYGMVILDTRAKSFRDMERMLLQTNGPAREAFICPNTQAKVYAYPEKGARLVSTWDYLNDTGTMKSTRLDRDAVIWQGDAAVAGTMHLDSVALRYRMERIWILLHFAESPEELAGKTIRVYAAGNRAKPAARLAGKYLSRTGDSALDAFWRQLAWKRTLVIGPETSAPGDNGGTVVFLEGPSRETKDLPMLLLEKDGKTTRIR
ncbi:MAG: hypothetical protein LIP28_03305, partial [Deltaproteobacteria bacterium]|nr:hypothetical protein [Deltaproteobacteria bacterium]